MTIWGKIIGGAAGFAIGGPLGAFLGALAGHAVDHIRHEAAERPPPPAEEAVKSIAFTIGVIVLGAKLAKADGKVSAAEVSAFREVFAVEEAELANVARVFDLAKRQADGYESYARQIARLFEPASPVLEKLIGSLFHIAKADGAISEQEFDYIRKVAGIFGFDDRGFERIRAAHAREYSLCLPCDVLGVAFDANDEEIRKAYRQLMRENHPDTLIAKGLPAEFIKLAHEKTAAINAAYAQLQAQRKAT